MHSHIAYGIPHKGAPLLAARHDLTALSRSLAKPLTNQSTHVHRKYSAYIHQVISLSRSLAKSTHVLQTWTTPRGMHVHLCDMTHSYMWHDALIFVIRRIIHVTWLIHTCDMTHSYMWLDSFLHLLTCSRNQAHATATQPTAPMPSTSPTIATPSTIYNQALNTSALHSTAREFATFRGLGGGGAGG